VSNPTTPPPVVVPTPSMDSSSECVFIVQGDFVIPAWVKSLEAFRRWAYSDSYPTQGWFSFLDNRVWVDVTMEELFTHNGVKVAFTASVENHLLRRPVGRFVGDRMLLTNTTANLSTEPDGLFFLWETMQSGRLRLVPGKEEGYMELEGTPDMVLEVVSKTSLKKDTQILPELYWKAGIPEYWLVDARGPVPKFEVLQWGAKGYVSSPAAEGWLPSNVFGCEFQLLRDTDPLGHPKFSVNVRQRMP
jgi:Uma2 family endonuclease